MLKDFNELFSVGAFLLFIIFAFSLIMKDICIRYNEYDDDESFKEYEKEYHDFVKTEYELMKKKRHRIPKRRRYDDDFDK